jgi:hypothetical protein
MKYEKIKLRPTHVRMQQDLWEFLHIEAARQCRSLSNLVNSLVAELRDKRENERKKKVA